MEQRRAGSFDMSSFLSPLVLVVSALAISACDTSAPAEAEGTTHGEIRSGESFVARGTAYYPANNAMEGGFKDRQGASLRTLQQFLSGTADYVSVAMDATAFPYGQRLRIRELSSKYGKDIVFRVVDTGGAFKGKKTSRIDICVANAAAADDSTINGTLHIDVVDGDTTAPTASADEALGGPTASADEAPPDDRPAAPASDEEPPAPWGGVFDVFAPPAAGPEDVPTPADPRDDESGSTDDE